MFHVGISAKGAVRVCHILVLEPLGNVLRGVARDLLGLGGSGNIPGWGSMIAAGQERLWRGVWWELGAASTLMFLLILALNLLGDSLRDALDPRYSLKTN